MFFPAALYTAGKSLKRTKLPSIYLLFSITPSSPFSSSCKTHQNIHQTPPPPPVPKKVPFEVSAHGMTWQDPYHWMKQTKDPDFINYLHQENYYADAFMDDTKTLQHTFYSEMTAARSASKISNRPERLGPWFYYQYIPEGKEFPVLCRKLATEKEGCFQIVLDYNELVKEYGYVDVYALVVSPNHNYLAYTLDVTGAERFMLQIKNLNTGLLENFKVDDVYNLVWAQDNCTLFYTTSTWRHCRVQSCTPEEDPIKNTIVYTETDPSFWVDIDITKDNNYIIVNSASKTSSEVYVIDANNVKSGLHKIQKCIPRVKYRLKHHHNGFFYALTDQPLSGDELLATGTRYLVRCPAQDVHETRWETVLVPGEDIIIMDIDIFNEHLVLYLERNGLPVLCSIKLPIDGSFKNGMKIDDLNPWYFPVPSNQCTIDPCVNVDFMSSQYRATVSSPVMSDVVVQYDMSRHTFSIFDHDEVVGNTAESNSCSIIHEKDGSEFVNTRSEKGEDVIYTEGKKWSDFSDAYCCEKKEVVSHDGINIPLTIVYSRKAHLKAQSPGLLEGYGAYGHRPDNCWTPERLSLLDRGWVVAFADVRGGAGTDSSWHKSGTGLYKSNSITDFVSCAKYLISEGYVDKYQLGAIGCSAGGLLVGAAANKYPELFRAIILEVPFLDVCNTLLNYPSREDHEEFGNPGIESEFLSIFSYSPYDNVPAGVCCPAMLVLASFNDSRVGVWEPAKWVAKVREITCSECSKAVILKTNMTNGHHGEPWDFCRPKEAAYKYAFLVKAMGLMDKED